MADLSTTYMGVELSNPIVVAGPTNDICLAAVDDVNGDGEIVGGRALSDS